MILPFGSSKTTGKNYRLLTNLEWPLVGRSGILLEDGRTDLQNTYFYDELPGGDLDAKAVTLRSLSRTDDHSIPSAQVRAVFSVARSLVAPPL